MASGVGWEERYAPPKRVRGRDVGDSWEIFAKCFGRTARRGAEGRSGTMMKYCSVAMVKSLEDEEDRKAIVDVISERGRLDIRCRSTETI